MSVKEIFKNAYYFLQILYDRDAMKSITCEARRNVCEH